MEEEEKVGEEERKMALIRELEMKYVESGEVVQEVVHEEDKEVREEVREDGCDGVVQVKEER